jgi:hypothetical protein
MTILRIAPFAASLLLLGCSSTPTPTTFQQSIKAVTKLADPRSKMVGKWHRKYTDQLFGHPSLDNIEFFASGDYSLSTITDPSFHSAYVNTEMPLRTSSGAGTYKFIDDSHIKFDEGIGSEIYELVSVSDKELLLKNGNGTRKWVAGFEAKLK